MKHGSLFSGIGGFDLASEWMGWENVFQVEIDPFCTKVLEKNFPNTKRYGDIRKFPASDYAGRIDIITGGFPCQPFSSAGKRKGREDDRHLWPEMLRVISIIKPTWVIAENVRGLLSIESGVVFEQVCIDLENIGYEVQPIIIPACAVNAPHRRDRIWFVGHAKHNGFNGAENCKGDIEGSNSDQEGQKELCESERTNRLRKDASDPEYKRPVQCEPKEWPRLEKGLPERSYRCDAPDPECQGHKGQKYQKGQGSRCDSGLEQWQRDWVEVATELCSLHDGLPVELGEFKRSKAGHRNEQIKAYGNAIVPQVAYQIFNSLS